MMKRKYLKSLEKGLILVVLATFAGCAERVTTPIVEPISNRMMKTPGYWISRHLCPDKVILTPDEINTLNLQIQNELHLTQDITKFPDQICGAELHEQLEKDLKDFRTKELYTQNNRRASQQLFDPIQTEMNLDAIGEKITVRFGLILHLADQRMLPSDMILCAKIGDVQFDELQNSALDIGTPVAVLHQTSDGQWSYIHDPLTPGWVKTKLIGFCSREQMCAYVNAKDFAVVTAPKADLFINPALTDFHDYVRMAVRLPLAQSPCGVNAGKEVSTVLIPWKNRDGSFVIKTAYMKNHDIHKGYLPYTPRNAINQAFAMLNQPYGWGGMYGEQDCSRFTQQVFATMGIHLPRNTGQQEQVGISLGDFDQQTSDEEKLAILKSQALGGITIMKFVKVSHVILYLGTVDGRPYGIHDTAAVNIFAGFGRYPIPSNRVMISDLQLGTQMPSGPLIKRLVKIRSIQK